MFDFTVRTAATVHDEQGAVEVGLYSDGVDIDRDRRNNQAPIKVIGTGRTPELPITGTVAASLTAAGILLVLIGAAVVGLMRRHSPRRPRRRAMHSSGRQGG